MRTALSLVFVGLSLICRAPQCCGDMTSVLGDEVSFVYEGDSQNVDGSVLLRTGIVGLSSTGSSLVSFEYDSNGHPSAPNELGTSGLRLFTQFQNMTTNSITKITVQMTFASNSELEFFGGPNGDLFSPALTNIDMNTNPPTRDPRRGFSSGGIDYSERRITYDLTWNDEPALLPGESIGLIHGTRANDQGGTFELLFTAVPEPISVTTFSAVLLCLGALRKRRI